MSVSPYLMLPIRTEAQARAEIAAYRAANPKPK